MKKGLKIVSLLAAGSAIMASLVACGGGEDNRTQITVWTTFNATYQAIIDKAVKSFEAKYPEYKISYVKQETGYSGLKDLAISGIRAGNYPDIVVAYPDSVADFIMTGKALNIEPYMTNEEYGWTQEDLDDIAPAFIEEGQSYMIPGTYSLPICKSTEAMYYNKAIIGLDLSAYDPDVNDGNEITEEYINNLTWEECFNHLCPALIAYNEAADDKIIIPGEYADTWAVMGYDSDDNLFITLAEQYGYGYTSVNPTTGNGSVEFVNEGMKSLMKTFNQAHLNHYFTTKGIVGKNVNYLSTTGAMIFSIGSTGGVSYQFSSSSPKDVGVARIPQAEGKETKVINQGPSIAFLKRDVDTELYAKGAWLFYKEWTSKDYATSWATTTGYTPIRNSTAESADFLAYSDENKFELNTIDRLKARNARYATTVADYLFASPVFYGSASCRDAVGGLLTDCVGNKGSTTPITDAEINTYFDNAYNNAH